MSFDTSKCELSMFFSQNLQNDIVEATVSSVPSTTDDDSSPLELCPDISNQTDEAVEALLETLRVKALKIQERCCTLHGNLTEKIRSSQSMITNLTDQENYQVEKGLDEDFDADINGNAVEGDVGADFDDNIVEEVESESSPHSIES